MRYPPASPRRARAQLAASVPWPKPAPGTPAVPLGSGAVSAQKGANAATVSSFEFQVTSTQHPTPSTQEAEACFHKAIAIARRQGAKSLELRAVMSLSRL